MNLYQINEEIERLLEEDPVDMETGEIHDEAGYMALRDLLIDKDVKIENTALYIKNLTVEINAIKAEEDALKARRIQKENKAKWLKSYLSDALLSDGLKTFETPRCKLSFRKSNFVDIPDPSKLPLKYQIKKVTTDPDRRLIKELLDSGAKVRGAAMGTRQSLQIK